MDNEVVIHVRADDDTDRGFQSARSRTRKFTADVDSEIRQTGPKIGAGLSGGMLSGLTSTLPSFGQFGGVVGAIMAPTLGAAMAAGVMGAAGGAGILGGLTIVARDPAVKGAAESLKKTIGDDLKVAASGFVPVAMESLAKLRAGFKGILPDLRSIFESSKGFVAPLLDGIIAGSSRIVGSVKSLVANAQPVFDAFGRSFESIGDSVGNVFDSLADNAPEGAAAVDDLTKSITSFIEVTGIVINGLAEFKGSLEDLDDWIDEVRYSLEDQTGWDLTADGMTTAQRKAGELAGSQKQLKRFFNDTTEAANEQVGALRELSDEMQRQTDPLFGLIGAQEDVAEAQRDYNEALRKHGPRSAEARSAMAKLGEAAFSLNSKALDAAGGFNGSLTPAMKTALRNAGVTKAEIGRLENQLRQAADAANDWAGTYTQTYITNYKSKGLKGPSPVYQGYEHGGVVGAATGGIHSGMRMVGEHGPELLDLPAGTRVHSNPDTERMLGGGGGGSTVVVTADNASAPGLVREIVKMLRFEVRAGGGNVQDYLGVAGR